METEKEYFFKANQLQEGLASLVELGVTKLWVQDRAITGSATSLLSFVTQAQEEAPEIFYKFYLEPSILDGKLCQALAGLYCSLQLPLDGKALSSRKVFEKKIALLNRLGLVFGFTLEYGVEEGDSARLFKERLNFALSLYPNHIDFPQLSQDLPAPTKTFSSRDLTLSADKAHGCTIFYTDGRAVPWFLTLLKPLRISTDVFFADFGEWLTCNNLGRARGESAFRDLTHKEIEGMQLLFLEIKYQEKGLDHLLPVVRDLVRFNGAFARLVGEDEEGVLDLAFNPHDLSSPYSQDVVSFAENVCMEQCRIRLAWMQDKEGNNFPDWSFV